MKTSQETSELSSAMAKATAKFPKIERGCTAKVFPKKEGAQPYSYDYADLDDVLSAVRGPLAENGVTLSHDAKLIREPLCLEVTARLEHSTGQFRESEPLPMPLEGTMSLAQQIGSAYTYGRRYTSQGILGISTEADDDGHGAGGQDAETGRRERQPNPVCPQCGSNENVIKGKAEYGGGWLCWKKPDQGKHGCGHKWQDEPVDEPPKNGKKSAAQKVADEHGLTTADKMLSVAVKSAFEKLSAAVAAHDTMAVAGIINAATERHDKGDLSAEALGQIQREATLALQKIKATEREPLPA